MRFSLSFMCGRFTQTKSREEILEQLGGIELPPLFHRRYNIAPSQEISIIRGRKPWKADVCTWGFRTSGTQQLIINARSESITERPLFKDLIQTHRGLVPADGFYEWKGKQPYYFQLEGRQMFAFAALWQKDRCVLLTRPAGPDMNGIHHRMPVILLREDWPLWMDSVQLPVAGPPLTPRPVSRRVNSTAFDEPQCLDAGDVQMDLSLFPDDDSTTL